MPARSQLGGHYWACNRGWLQGMVYDFYFLGFSHIFHGTQNETIPGVGIFDLPVPGFFNAIAMENPWRDSGYQIAMDFLPGFTDDFQKKTPPFAIDFPLHFTGCLAK
jgi:hypothetical protein